ncbi:fad binding domain-containing protein [Moniliophthora roreri MCA 2997]|uniref:Fad binding domain-containing protein n=1 Tax=Moniliophthora roreri (strain MCA 2997) TaxID=1381753 RepID=V2WT96_MONRO|nr:fad binding domain-containing protein [Moniliophthora roreri MCA 2997]
MSSECVKIRGGYRDEVFLTSLPTGYTNPQWETCQSNGDQCLFDSRGYISQPERCRIGSMPSYFIDVQSERDVQAAFRLSKEYNITLVIKNTGHDYKGRSSAPGSLALWISYESAFIPEGCEDEKTYSGVTMGAGVQWHEAFAFAERHNVTLVGGSDRTVGTSGGWLQGGGHSMLSNTMGLGVDRVLQFRVVTPSGHYLTANSCQNQDLFFALRGGGGGTYGVVMESTMIASPQITLQMVLVSFKASNQYLTRELWTILVSNGLRWAGEGWGGIATSNIAIYINPKLSKEEASHSMSPLLQFAERLRVDSVPGTTTVVAEFPSWGQFFDWFTDSHVASVGISLALSSRLIDQKNFRTPINQQALIDSLLEASKITPRLLIMLSTPFSFPGDGQTSTTEAWRSSLYHITVTSTWSWNATVDEKRDGYATVQKSISYLRALTPDAAYLNEADVYEPNHEVSFWGSNYERLLEIKQKYDPDHLLDCWQCVGWKPSSSRFSCYL